MNGMRRHAKGRVWRMSNTEVETEMNIRRLLVAIALLAVCLASLEASGRAYRSVEVEGNSTSAFVAGVLFASPFGVLSAVALVFAVRLLFLHLPSDLDRSRWVRSRYSEQFESRRKRDR